MDVQRARRRPQETVQIGDDERGPRADPELDRAVADGHDQAGSLRGQRSQQITEMALYCVDVDGVLLLRGQSQRQSETRELHAGNVELPSQQTGDGRTDGDGLDLSRDLRAEAHGDAAQGHRRTRKPREVDLADGQIGIGLVQHECSNALPNGLTVEHTRQEQGRKQQEDNREADEARQPRDDTAERHLRSGSAWTGSKADECPELFAGGNSRRESSSNDQPGNRIMSLASSTLCGTCAMPAQARNGPHGTAPCSLCSWLLPSHWPSSSPGRCPRLICSRGGAPNETD